MRLLGTYDKYIGGKTGFTPLAGKSLLSATEDSTGKHRVVGVILNDPTRSKDMVVMLDWVYDNYKWE